jgi:hypothetical protein
MTDSKEGIQNPEEEIRALAISLRMIIKDLSSVEEINKRLERIEQLLVPSSSNWRRSFGPSTGGLAKLTDTFIGPAYNSSGIPIYWDPSHTHVVNMNDDMMPSATVQTEFLSRWDLSRQPLGT